jgi:hypothetical protein
MTKENIIVFCIALEIIVPLFLVLTESFSGHLRPVYAVIRKTSDEFSLTKYDRCKLYVSTTMQIYFFTSIAWPMILFFKTLHLFWNQENKHD